MHPDEDDLLAELDEYLGRDLPRCVQCNGRIDEMDDRYDVYDTLCEVCERWNET